MTDIWDQLALTPEPARHTRADDTCRNCGQRVRRIVAGDVAGLPAVVSRHPVDRVVALAAMATGRAVYIRRRAKRATTWDRLGVDNIRSGHAAAGDHHLDHICGHDPPQPPPPPTIDRFPTDPPF